MLQSLQASDLQLPWCRAAGPAAGCIGAAPGSNASEAAMPDRLSKEGDLPANGRTVVCNKCIPCQQNISAHGHGC